MTTTSADGATRTASISAFATTNLDERLREAGVGQVIPTSWPGLWRFARVPPVRR
jgi:hypothetical protein